MTTKNKKKIKINIPPTNRSSSIDIPIDVEKKIDEWVTQEKIQPKEDSQTTKDKQTQRMSADIESELFLQFKKHCVSQNVTIKQKLEELICKEIK